MITFSLKISEILLEEVAGGKPLDGKNPLPTHFVQQF